MRKLALACVILVILGQVPCALGYSGGTGTTDNPFQISTPDDLVQLASTPADWDGSKFYHFVLTQDLDMSGYTLGPIGTSFTACFANQFDGRGHAICHLSLNLPSTLYVGLFGVTGIGAEVRNLYLLDCVVVGSSMAGALAGVNQGYIYNCSSSGTVSGHYTVGGLVGFNGGMVGWIHKCRSNGTVASTSTGGFAGGLVGNNYSTILNCYSASSVSSVNGSTGGLAGRSSDQAALLQYCYSVGPVLSGYYKGGLVGTADYGTILDCCWNYETSGMTAGIGQQGPPANVVVRIYSLDSDQMRQRSIFTDIGWDFVGESYNGNLDVWRMCQNGLDYPSLNWENALRGDLDCPDGVGLEDLCYLAARWLASGDAMIAGDITGDGKVNLRDLAWLADHWPN